MTGWAPILAAAAIERQRFVDAARDPERAQSALLRALLADNAETEFGLAHGFAHIRSVEEFRARVPVRDYDALRPFVDRALAGEPRVLTRDPIVCYEETGGSSGGRKLIPYTQASLAGFRAAVLPWLADLAQQRPAAFCGSAYVAVSPAGRAARKTLGGIPIGLTEGEYLGADLAPALARVMAVPPTVAAEGDLARWRFVTLLHLLRARDLTLISIWSPTFLIGLIESIGPLADRLVAAIHAGGEPLRAREIAGALAGNAIDTALLWPKLDTISAWADGVSARYAAQLAGIFPHAHLQPKGLLATEGAVTLPWRGSPHGVPALLSAFLEFIDDDGRPALVHELREGEAYRVSTTTAGGLYRYNLSDRVYCASIIDRLPRLEFIGRAGIVGDLVGEKLTESFVASALAGIAHPACLSARQAPVPGYELLLDASVVPPDLAATVERRLRDNPQYAFARDIGQLAPVTCRRVEGLLDRHRRAELRRGRRLGDIKPPVLVAPCASVAP